jgi:uncharacterized protein (TIGR02145 family)
MNNGDTFFEYIFTYNGGINPGDSSLLIWGTSYNKRGKMEKGLTEMADQNFGNFNLTLIDGRIYISGTTTLNIKVFLEGAFVDGAMTTNLNAAGMLPLTQPYNIAPWNYEGTESVTSIPNNDIVDWVLVELRETSGDATTATPATRIARRAGFLNKDGFIVDIDGVSPLLFNTTITQNLFVVIWHRNHLSIMSAVPLTISGGIYNYNFTDNMSKTYGGVLGQKEIANEIWGMISGDGNSNGRINLFDKNDIWLLQAGKSGYKLGDYNLDTQVENQDKNNKWFCNRGKSSQVEGGVNLVCSEQLIDSRDGQTYNIIQIGTQCWMAKNLNIGPMIPSSIEMENNNSIEKYCYENNTENCDIFGGLYQWNEMMQYSITPGVQGICPIGWHIPTDIEWTVLTDFLSGESEAGGKLKEAGTIHWTPPNSGANNQSGFTALPCGYRCGPSCGFSGLGNRALFWSSNLYSEGGAWGRELSYSYIGVYRYDFVKYVGVSVRCVKD